MMIVADCICISSGWFVFFVFVVLFWNIVLVLYCPEGFQGELADVYVFACDSSVCLFVVVFSVAAANILIKKLKCFEVTFSKLIVTNDKYYYCCCCYSVYCSCGFLDTSVKINL